MEGRDARGPGVTLLVRHLPDALPQQTLKRLFAQYGASDLRSCIHGRLKNCAFIDFPDEASAARAQSHFHRLHLLGKTLAVERSRSKEEEEKRRGGVAVPDISGAAAKPSSSVHGEAIAPCLGVNYPFPPHLQYAYPPPDANILANIVNSLIAVPRFYTQVLHLMNKMNLPAPFRPALPAPPLPNNATRHVDVASDESELESSEEEKDAESRSRKRKYREAIMGSAAAKDASHEAAGVKAMVIPSNSISSIKKKQPVLQIKIVPKTDGKTKPESVEAKVEVVKRFATREELNKGKLSPAQAANSSVFKNYNRGDPSPVLYIKNLEKDVLPEDLYYVFGGFFPSFEVARKELDIKLMQEGRMKGQAFVRFPSAEIAGEALAGVHSYVLKGKAMVIQFGRNK